MTTRMRITFGWKTHVLQTECSRRSSYFIMPTNLNTKITISSECFNFYVVWSSNNSLCHCIVATYYVTWGGHAVDAAPGSPMPPHGKSLGKIAAADFKSIIEKGLIQYGK